MIISHPFPRQSCFHFSAKLSTIYCFLYTSILKICFYKFINFFHYENICSLKNGSTENFFKENSNHTEVYSLTILFSLQPFPFIWVWVHLFVCMCVRRREREKLLIRVMVSMEFFNCFYSIFITILGSLRISQ